MTHHCWERPLRFVSIILELQLHSYGKNSPGSYTTDNIPRVCDILCKNNNNSDRRKETIHLHALPEYPLKLSSNNERTSANHRRDSVLIHSCSILPNLLQGIGKMQSIVTG